MPTKPATKSLQSSARAMQAKTEAPPQRDEQQLSVTLRDDKTFEYHLVLPRSAIDAMLDPDVPDAFIEVPCVVRNTKRFLHTSYVKEVDVRGME